MTELQRAARPNKLVATATLMAGEYSKKALEMLPPTWKEAWPEGKWDQFSPQQITDRANAGKPLCFDKAVLSVLALHAYAMDVRPTCNVFEKVHVCPAIYVAHGFTKAVWEDIKRIGKSRYGLDFMVELKAATLQEDEQVFDRLAENVQCTRATVDALISFLHAKGLVEDLRCHRTQFRNDRNYPRKGKTPNAYETCTTTVVYA
jgi:hypothetical protein